MADIELALHNIKQHPQFEQTKAEYERLLKLIGNVDGVDDNVALVVLACWNETTILELD